MIEPELLYTHIARVHPLSCGNINPDITLAEQEFETKDEAKQWIKVYNRSPYVGRAVYVGCLNHETGDIN